MAKRYAMVRRGVRGVQPRKPNPVGESWPAQHPFLTFFLGLAALSTISTVVMMAAAPKVVV